jgi:hypothetical protein
LNSFRCFDGFQSIGCIGKVDYLLAVIGPWIIGWMTRLIRWILGSLDSWLLGIANHIRLDAARIANPSVAGTLKWPVHQDTWSARYLRV